MFETQVRDGAAESAADPAGELLAAIGNAERVVASMQAAQLCAVAELDALWSGTELADFVADEVALALRISPGAARERLHLARTPSGRLPDTLAALRRGDIDLYKARAIAEACARLDDEAARAVQARMLPGAASQTGAQLKAALRRAVAAIDPHGAERRHAAAAKGRRVELTRPRTGWPTCGRGCPPTTRSPCTPCSTGWPAPTCTSPSARTPCWAPPTSRAVSPPPPRQTGRLEPHPRPARPVHLDHAHRSHPHRRASRPRRPTPRLQPATATSDSDHPRAPDTTASAARYRRCAAVLRPSGRR